MKKKTNYYLIKRISILWVVFTVLSSILAITFYNSIIVQIEKEQLEQGVKELAKTQVKYIDSIVRSIQEDAMIIKFIYENKCKDNEQLFINAIKNDKDVFNHYFSKGLAKEIVFIDKNKNMYSARGIAESNWVNDDWKLAFSGQTFINSELTTKDGKTVIIFAMPLGTKQELVMLYAYDLDSFSGIIDINSFNGQGFGHIIHCTDGKYVYNSKNPVNKNTGSNYFDYIPNRVFLDDNTIETIKEKVFLGEEFIANYKIDDSKRIAYYTPLNYEDWYLVTIAETSAFKSQFDSKKTAGIVALAVILGSLAILIAYIVKVGNDFSKEMKKAQEEIDLRNRKFRVVASQVSGIIFEYNLGDQGINIISNINSRKINRNMWWSFNDLMLKIVYPDDIHIFKRLIKNVEKGKGDVSEDIRMKFNEIDGYVWYRVRVFKLSEEAHDPYLGTCQDIAEIKHIEEKQEKQKYLQSLLINDYISLYLVNLTKDTIILSNHDELLKDIEHTGYSSYIGKISEKYIEKSYLKEFKKIFNIDNLIKQFNLKKHVFNFECKALLNNSYRFVNFEVKLNLDETGNDILMTVFVNDIEEKKLREDNLKQMAWKDALTGLANKNAANVQFKNYKKFLKPNSYHALFFLDLDNLKDINDNYGHDIGDRVLENIGKLLKKLFRSTDFICRWGGDEFLVIMNDLNSPDNVESRANEILNAIRNIKIVGYEDMETSCSIGYVVNNNTEIGIEVLFKAADLALYEAKRNGKNQYRQGKI